jgi:hypothetical protein
MSLQTSQAPYFDDFSEDNGFYKILFRPGFPVQARELTQLQTIIQNQVSKFGEHIFKNGSMVVPGQVSFSTEAQYVKLAITTTSGIPTNTVIDSFIGKKVVGRTSGIVGEVLAVAGNTLDGVDPNTIYVRYETSSLDGNGKVFLDNEAVNVEGFAFDVNVTGTGFGSTAFIGRGIYFVNGYFVLVEEQTIILDKYTRTPSYRVGLKVFEKVVTSDEDSSLLDPSLGSPNFAAPGAHRQFIALNLTKIPLNSVDDSDFIELLALENGLLQRIVNKTAYGAIEDTLARRTYDESGDYVVTNFDVAIKEERNNNQGEWQPGRQYYRGDYSVSNSKLYLATNNAVSGTNAPSHATGIVSDAVTGGVLWEQVDSAVYNLGQNINGNPENFAMVIDPGKAYVRGYEIEKTGQEVLSVPKSRDFKQTGSTYIDPLYGNYVQITNASGVVPIANYAKIELHSHFTTAHGTSPAAKIGTARVRHVEKISGTPGSTTEVFNLYLFDVVLNTGFTFSRDVKGLFYDNPAGGATKDFSADVVPDLVQLTGSISVSNTSVTGNGTSFTTQLKIGDYIKFDGVTTRVTAIASDNALTISSNANVTNLAFYRVEVINYESALTDALFELNTPYVRSVRNSSNQNATAYTAVGTFTGTASAASGGTCTLSITSTSGSFASGADSDNYIIYNNETGHTVPFISVSVAGNNATITLSSTYANVSFVVIAAINKTGTLLTEKIKTLSTQTLTISTSDLATAKKISLGKADGFRIKSIKQDSGTFDDPTGLFTKNITNNYSFDNGQRDSFYDLASISLKSGASVPSAPIQIVFEYFQHSNGDYFTVNSYNSIDYSQIPSINGVYLADVIDFRPRISDDGLNFVGAGSNAGLFIKPGTSILTDYSYYLPRIDSVSLASDGKFIRVAGIPSELPTVPSKPDNAMALYNVNIPAYTGDVREIFLNPFDNKRYTMRDIGKIEKRVANLEEYAILNTLEQNTANTSIYDSKREEKFKTGFIVDNFSDTKTANTESPEFSVSIDPSLNECQPSFTVENVDLVESATSAAARAASNYALTGDLITLPFTEVKYIENPFASRIINVNPYAVFTFIGNMDLTPSSDTWFETRYLPQIVIRREGNFNLFKNLYDGKTQWNSWQTNWSGVLATRTEQVMDWVNGRFGFETNTTVQSNQTRTGVTTSVTERFDNKLIGDRIVSTTSVPFIRARRILVQTKALKPSTKFFPFFDNVDVSPYIDYPTRIAYSTTSPLNFDDSTNVGGDIFENARKISGDTTSSLSRGDVIRNSNGATAVVIGTFTENNIRYLDVINVKGTFSTGNVITGSISNATGTIITTPTVLNNLISNKSGELNFIFRLPCDDIQRFNTGTRQFKLIDSSTNNQTSGNYTSVAFGSYEATGVLNTRQQTIESTRNANVASQYVSETRTTITNQTTFVAQDFWVDPLAQSFFVDNSGGCFITSVDIYFASKDASIPVSLEIREMVNGYPGKKIVPFSKVVLKPSDVKISGSTVTVDGANVASFNTPTRFTFKSPVYLMENTEYCFVLLSDSNKYNVWISHLGDKIPGTTRYISEQPYAGSMFKSQNASTWTAEQMEDIKFTINRAKFNTNVNAVVDFVNGELPQVNLTTDPIATTNGVSKVRVNFPNNCLSVGDKVNLVNTDETITSINGIPSSEIFGEHIVLSTDPDSIVIDVATNATATGFGGGDSVFVVPNITFNNIHPNIQHTKLVDTSIDFQAAFTTGKSYDGTEIAYSQTGYTNVQVGDNTELPVTYGVYSKLNETTYLASNKSLKVRAFLSSKRDNLSPVIDVHRTDVTLIRHELNAPTFENSVVSDIDRRLIISDATDISSSTTGFSSSNASRQQLNTIEVGQYIRVDSTSNSGDYLVTDVSIGDTSTTITVNTPLTASTTGQLVNVSVYDRFFEETNPNSGSARSKYVTKSMVLNNSSDYLSVAFDANLVAGSDVRVFYKISPVGSTLNFENQKWVEMTLENRKQFVSFGTKSFTELRYRAENLPNYDTVAVKVVEYSSNQSAKPIIRRFRMIAGV